MCLWIEEPVMLPIIENNSIDTVEYMYGIPSVQWYVQLTRYYVLRICIEIEPVHCTICMAAVTCAACTAPFSDRVI